MDVVGSLVGVDRFKVEHVPYRVILEGDPVTTQDFACAPRAKECLTHVVALGQAYLRELQVSFVLDSAQPPREEQACCVVGGHLHELVLHELPTGYGPVEGDPGLRELECLLVNGLECTESSPGDAVAGLGQTTERGTQARPVGKPQPFGNPDILKNELAGYGRPQAHLVLHQVGRETLNISGHDESLD